MKNILTSRMLTIAVIALALVMATSATVGEERGEETKIPYQPVEPEVVDHTQFFEEKNITQYNGSATCIACHYDDTVEFFHSYHYQMANPVDDIVGRQMVLYGGKYVYNDFCGAIFWRGNKSVNYIGKAVLKAPPPGYEELKGKFIASGCSMCHGVSMGLVPQPEASDEQLGNMDCLACHVKPDVYLSGPLGLKKGMKEVYKDENGVWRYRLTDKVPIDKIASSIIDKPYKENCLACHAFSGGGPGFKRPNLTPDLMGEVSEEVDVHLARGLTCVDCHPGDDHGFPTSSADTWSREEGVTRQCSSCHGGEPHGGLEGFFLNRFHERVACQTCHIPVIADGNYPTDVFRDWSKSHFIEEAAKYEPEIKFESSVKPVYAWYNGTRAVYVYPEPVEPDENGEILLAKPLGSRGDPASKIYPYKLHKTKVPYSTVARIPVPVKVGIVFATGNNTKAVLAGASVAGIEWDGQWATLVRYMAVNHGVKPAEEAKWCLDCHGPVVRDMPWDQLGYGSFPEAAFTLITIAVVAAVALAVWFAARRLRG